VPGPKNSLDKMLAGLGSAAYAERRNVVTGLKLKGSTFAGGVLGGVSSQNAIHRRKALTLQCEASVEHAARIEFGRVATTRQLKQQPVIQADIYIRTKSERAVFEASTMKLS
jgi:hypothetical protein